MRSIKKAFWNGEPAEARAVKVIVGKSPRASWWCANLEGKEHQAIEIKQHGQTFYINDDKNGRLKITEGMGAPQYGHRGIPVEKVIE